MKPAHCVAGLWLLLCSGGLVAMSLVTMGAGRPEVTDPGSSHASAPIPAQIDFNRDVRPIISANCIFCHGPDERAREAGLRLDLAEGISATLKSGAVAVVPGDLAKSALIQRIECPDPKDIMPPVKTGKVLTRRQIDILRRWIEQGGHYDRHWSLNPPRKHEAPPVTDAAWARTPIDSFVEAELEQAGLSHAPEADKRTLIRRLSLDLTGLPPTPQEVRAFVDDRAPDAYEKLVDRLLASPHYGERMATDWLDAARYGDTNGYHIDNERFMWKWRDWVIDAFNSNVPFDRFTVEQLAGDMLPDDPDPAVNEKRKVASGFHRNHMINFEGGAIPEEYLHNYLVDRVNTTSTVWLGLTMNCAQCHDHKYDPITQEDYYRFYAFFNNIPEKGLDGNTGNSEPFIKMPSEAEKAKLEDLLARSRALDEKLSGPMPEVDVQQASWEAQAKEFRETGWSTTPPISAVSTGGATLTVQQDQSILVSGAAPDRDTYELLYLIPGGAEASASAIRVEALTDASLPENGPGRSPNGNVVLTNVSVEAVPVNDPSSGRKIALVNALADYSQDKFDVRRAIDDKPDTGWATGSHLVRQDREAVFVFDAPVHPAAGTILKVRLSFDSMFAKHSLGKFRVSLLADESHHPLMAPARMSSWSSLGPIPAGTTPPAALAQEPPFKIARDVDLTATYNDGALKWERREDLLDGQINMLPSLDYQAMYFHRAISTQTPRRMTISLGSDDAIRVWLDGVKVHEAGLQGRSPAPDQDSVSLDLEAGDHTLLVEVINFTGGFALYFNRTADDGMPASLGVAKLLAAAPETRTDEQKKQIQEFFRSTRVPAWRDLKRERDDVLAEHKRLDAMLPTVMVMKELETPRKTNIHVRGQYDTLGAEVTPAVPHALPQLPQGTAPTRLALANWLIDGNNPLTARVYVNRLWQGFFGNGLVKTSEDFGLQGQWPSHPELLDWLAVDFVEHGWDIKRMVRQIVMSSTYRQASRATAKALDVDPEDRLLSYHPRVRLNAEGIRDNALTISGLMTDTIGGPSFRPYQPPGLWEEMSLDPTGASFSAQVYVQDHGPLLYRRSMYIFRKRSVPFPMLQIFDAPNRETCSVRRARTNTPLQALVVLNEPAFVEAARNFAQRVMKTPGDDRARLAWAFEEATSQEISREQETILSELLASQRAAFQGSSDAEKLLAVGESPRDTSLDVSEHAAWTMVCSAILNLDQTLVKD